MSRITVVGAGLAGSEAAWQLAQAGLSVELVEMKPAKRTPAQISDDCAELVCSNSLRSNNPLNAVGLLKEEMHALGSLIIQTALKHRVPAGDALAVDRLAFGQAITYALSHHPRIKRVTKVLEALPDELVGKVIIATGPLTTDGLAQDLAAAIGTQSLYFYDAIAPIISGDSIDLRIAFAASRYNKGDGQDYLNCPMDKAQYETFLQELLQAPCMPLHAFEEPKYFQGCLPIEVVAQSGPESLRFGTMKPVGLYHPDTQQRPYAVVQLRREDINGQAFNMVGFQTKMTYPAQKHVLRLIPGLEQAEFLRYGAIHRNTYIDSPNVLRDNMTLKSRPHIRLAGQITGVEGYVESAAHGLLTAMQLIAEHNNTSWQPPPLECALGALWGHVRGVQKLPGRAHEPQNINWSMFAPPPAHIKRAETKAWRVARARLALVAWCKQNNITCELPAQTTEPHATSLSA